MKRKLNSNLEKLFDVPPLKNKLKRGREFLSKLEDSTLKDQLMGCEILTYDPTIHITADELGFINLHKLNKQGERRFVEYFRTGSKVYLQKNKKLSGSNRVFFMRNLAETLIIGKLKIKRNKIEGTNFYTKHSVLHPKIPKRIVNRTKIGQEKYEISKREMYSKGDFNKFIEFVYKQFENNPGLLFGPGGEPATLDLDELDKSQEEIISYWEDELYPLLPWSKLEGKKIDRYNRKIKNEERLAKKIMKNLSPEERKIIEEDNAKKMEITWKKTKPWKKSNQGDMSGFE